MFKYVTWFEQIVIAVLIFMMAVVVLLATVELGWEIVEAMAAPPLLLLGLDRILNIFGLFLLVLIGIELVETIKVFFTERAIRVEVVLMVGIIAIARKVVVLDIRQISSLTLIGIGFIVIALTAGYYLIRLSHKKQ
ncbi:MAG: phosphate-starvation-inducible PsiE family protein [bacterium]